MLQPKRMIGDGFNLVSGLQHPAFTPYVDDSVLVRRGIDELHWNFQDDGVDVLARLRIHPGIDEAEIAVLVLGELVAFPCPRPGREVLLVTASPLGKSRIVVEEIVAFQLKQRLGDGQLARFRHGMRNVIVLRRVIDGAEESWQVIEERVVASADVDRKSTRLNSS